MSAAPFDWVRDLDLTLLQAWVQGDLPPSLFADHIEEVADGEVAREFRGGWALQIATHCRLSRWVIYGNRNWVWIWNTLTRKHKFIKLINTLDYPALCQLIAEVSA